MKLLYLAGKFDIWQNQRRPKSVQQLAPADNLQRGLACEARIQK